MNNRYISQMIEFLVRISVTKVQPIKISILYKISPLSFFRTDPPLYHKIGEYGNCSVRKLIHCIHLVAQETRIIGKLFIFNFFVKKGRKITKFLVEKWFPIKNGVYTFRFFISTFLASVKKCDKTTVW